LLKCGALQTILAAAPPREGVLGNTYFATVYTVTAPNPSDTAGLAATFATDAMMTRAGRRGHWLGKAEKVAEAALMCDLFHPFRPAAAQWPW
jgi:hypothetical protein